VQRACDLCGDTYEAKRSTSRFCKPAHRTAWARGSRPATELPASPPSGTPEGDLPQYPKAAEMLARELDRLGVLESFEAAAVLILARQLDSGVIVGAAAVSLSKEIDRRADALRLKADLPNDPVKAILGKVEDKQQHLRLA
jgi:hypothetical protein